MDRPHIPPGGDCAPVNPPARRSAGRRDLGEKAMFGEHPPRDPESAGPYGVGNGPALGVRRATAPKKCDDVVADHAPRVVGLCGFAGSGKSEAAAALEREGYTRLRFAGPLKAILRDALSRAGLGDVAVDRRVEGDLKEVPCDYLGGKTPRHFMQAIGEWARREIHPDFWVNMVMPEAEKILAQGGRVVFEDVRHLNEAAAIKGTEVDNATGARELWQVKGRRAHLPGDAATHASEQNPARLLPDFVLNNTRDIAHLAGQVLDAIPSDW